MNEIKFYKTSEPYGFLSNFAPYPIFIDRIVWPSSEHYFQSSKFQCKEIKSIIRSIESPMKAAIEGRSKTNLIRDDWELVKNDFMRKAIKAKFFQHHDLKISLLKTGESFLVEHTDKDSYWGDGGNGLGKNVLGLLLMELRTILKDTCMYYEWVFPPWIAFPEIDQFDMFWRMGIGENYMYIWAKWYNSLDNFIKKEYKEYFFLDPSWEGFFE